MDTFYADVKSLHGNTYCKVYSHKVGSLLATPSLLQKGEVLEKHLMTLSITLVLLNISLLMVYNPMLGEMRNSRRICVGIGLITISLHRSDPMKILLKVS